MSHIYEKLTEMQLLYIFEDIYGTFAHRFWAIEVDHKS